MPVRLSKNHQTLKDNIKEMSSGGLIDLLNKSIESVQRWHRAPTDENKGFTLAAKIATIMDSEEALYVIAKTYVQDYEKRFNTPPDKVYLKGRGK